MNDSYFNTTGETGETLKDYHVTATTQNEYVLELFKLHNKLSPSMAWRKYLLASGKANTPLTSIRRSISTLTNQGVLEQTEEKVKGSYGRNEFFWRLK